MAEQTENETKPARRSRWRSWLPLTILGAVLTSVGLTIGNGGFPQIELYPKVEGISEAERATP